MVYLFLLKKSRSLIKNGAINKRRGKSKGGRRIPSLGERNKRRKETLPTMEKGGISDGLRSSRAYEMLEAMVREKVFGN